MKIFESTHTFDHSWDRVGHAAWRKYPNPINPAVTGIDVLHRQVDANTGMLCSRRILQTKWDVPSWVTGLIGLRNPSYTHETSEVDPVNKVMVLKSVNLDCTSFISVDEQLTYQPHPQFIGKTLLTQSTEIKMFGVPLVDRLETMMIDKFRAQTQKGRAALEWVIDNVSREYDELTNKLSGEMVQLSHKLSTEIDQLAKSVDDVQRRALGAAPPSSTPTTTVVGDEKLLAFSVPV